MNTLSDHLGDRSDEADVEKLWRVYNILPKLPSRVEADWVTDELRVLTKKKRNAWLGLCDNATDETLKLEYQQLKKLLKDAAEKARNH